MINYLSCWACSPEGGLFFDSSTRQPAACQWFCDEVHAECSGIAVPIEGTDSKRTLGDAFEDGTALCVANGFTVVPAAEGGDDPGDINAPCYQPRDGVDTFPSNAGASAASSPVMFLLASSLANFVGAPSPLPQALVLLALASQAQVLAASSSDFPNAETCPYYNNRQPKTLPGGGQCDWYREGACCSTQEVEELAAGAIELVGASGDCKAALRYHMCWPCAPYQQYFYSRVAYRPTMCESWCDFLLSACSGAEFKGQSLGARFDTGRELCKALHFEVSEANDFGSCFMKASDHRVEAAAASHGPGVMAVAAVSAATALAGSKRRALTLLLVAVSLTLLPSASAVGAPEIKAAATALSADLQDIARGILRTDELQGMYNAAKYNSTAVDAAAFTAGVAARLTSFFSAKVSTVNELATSAASANTGRVGPVAWEDMDLPTTDALSRLQYSDAFSAKVDESASWVKIADSTPRTSEQLNKDIDWTSRLDTTWKENLQADADVRWQYIGTPSGMFRNLPGYRWSTNWQGFPSDYDPRFRPWYVGAISGPKDVVIVMDCSSSMRNHAAQAKAAAKALLGTLTIEDHVQVVCERSSYWGEKDQEARPTRVRRTESIGCIQHKLLPATSSIINDFSRRLSNEPMDGATDFGAGLDEAHRLMTVGNRQGCQRIIIMISDGSLDDGEGVRCGRAREEQRCSSSSSSSSSRSRSRSSHVDFGGEGLLGKSNCRKVIVPGPKCEASRKDGWSAARSLMSQDPTLRILGITVGDNPLYCSTLACEYGKAVHMHVTSVRDVTTTLQPYFSFLAARSSSSDPVVSAPYVDSSGLGLVMTISKPVLIRESLVGVVGVDVALAAVENLVANARWGSVYGFLMNEDGEAIVHPLLKPTSQLNSNPIFPKIELLEGSDPDFLAVRDAMIAGQTGSRLVANQQKLVPMGDALEGFLNVTGDWVYHYAPIPGSRLTFALVFADPQDLTRLSLLPEHNASTTLQPPLGVDFYHYLQGYVGPNPRVPGLEGELQATMATGSAASSSFYPDLLVTKAHSTFKFAPSAFCFPAAYLQDVAATNFKALHDFVNVWGPGRAENSGCASLQSGSSSSSALVMEARPEVELTHKMEAVWRNRSAADTENTVWTYFGTVNGVYRSFPGQRSSLQYDPTKRTWFHRAKTHPALVSVSTPYLDAGGAGRVSTMSQPVFFGKDAVQSGDGNCTASPGSAGCNCTSHAQCTSGVCRNGTCASSLLAGVVATDFKYSYFHSRVMATISGALGGGTKGRCGASYSCSDSSGSSILCTTACYVLDTAGLVVASQEFADASPTDEYAFTNVGLGRLEGSIAAALQASGVLVRGATTDFQGSCDITPAFMNAPASTTNLTLTVAEAEDDRASRGLFPPASNTFGCTQDVVTYTIDSAAFDRQATDGILTLAFPTGCSGGTAHLTHVNGTNALLMVVTDRYSFEGDPFRFGCHVVDRLSTQGRTQVLNGTCAEASTNTATDPVGSCPALKDPRLSCSIEDAAAGAAPASMALAVVILAWVWAHHG